MYFAVADRHPWSEAAATTLRASGSPPASTSCTTSPDTNPSQGPKAATAVAAPTCRRDNRSGRRCPGREVLTVARGQRVEQAVPTLGGSGRPMGDADPAMRLPVTAEEGRWQH